jgi:hypothetical protein
MEMDFDDNRRELDHTDIPPATEKASWLLVLVLLGGVLITGPYLWARNQVGREVDAVASMSPDHGRIDAGVGH